MGILIAVFAIALSSTCSKASAFLANISYHRRDCNSRIYIRFKGGEAGSDLFPSASSKGYVPSGLTREQYESIKRTEREKESKMNYGSWGPRFNKTEGPPIGDWMVLPSLWTKGFASHPPSQDVTGNAVVEKLNTSSMTKKLTTSIPVLGYIVIDVIMAITYALHRNRESSLLLIAAHKIKRLTFNISIMAVLKNTILKFIALAILTKPVHIVLSRRRK